MQVLYFYQRVLLHLGSGTLKSCGPEFDRYPVNEYININEFAKIICWHYFAWSNFFISGGRGATNKWF